MSQDQDLRYPQVIDALHDENRHRPHDFKTHLNLAIVNFETMQHYTLLDKARKAEEVLFHLIEAVSCLREPEGGKDVD